jgi:hypothetical protein
MIGTSPDFTHPFPRRQFGLVCKCARYLLDLIPLLPHDACPGIRDKPTHNLHRSVPLLFSNRLGEGLFETLDVIT